MSIIMINFNRYDEFTKWHNVKFYIHSETNGNKLK